MKGACTCFADATRSQGQTIASVIHSTAPIAASNIGCQRWSLVFHEVCLTHLQAEMSFKLKPSVGTWWASQSFLPLDQGSTDSTCFETRKLATFEKKQYRASQSERIGAFPRFQRRRLLQVPNEDALWFLVWHSWV